MTRPTLEVELAHVREWLADPGLSKADRKDLKAREIRLIERIAVKQAKIGVPADPAVVQSQEVVREPEIKVEVIKKSRLEGAFKDLPYPIDTEVLVDGNPKLRCKIIQMDGPGIVRVSGFPHDESGIMHTVSARRLAPA